MSNKFQYDQGELESLQEEIAEIRSKLRQGKEKDNLESQLVKKRERQGQLIETVADLGNRPDISLEPYLLNRIQHETELSIALTKLKWG